MGEIEGESQEQSTLDSTSDAHLAFQRACRGVRPCPRRAPAPEKQRGTRSLSASPSRVESSGVYLRCLLTSLVISNIETLPLPLKTGFSLSSALIMRRSFASWRLLRLMYP